MGWGLNPHLHSDPRGCSRILNPLSSGGNSSLTVPKVLPTLACRVPVQAAAQLPVIRGPCRLPGSLSSCPPPRPPCGSTGDFPPRADTSCPNTVLWRHLGLRAARARWRGGDPGSLAVAVLLFPPCSERTGHQGHQGDQADGQCLLMASRGQSACLRAPNTQGGPPRSFSHRGGKWGPRARRRASKAGGEGGGRG